MKMIKQHSFEQFIIECCKTKEWNLRKFLKKTLRTAGFSIIEDDYKSYRNDKNKHYKKVKNMLAIRGENPEVCLVAHTDVCRDHAEDKDIVNPVIKTEIIQGELRRIIQDKDTKIQVGADDRLGVAIATWIAIHTGYNMGLLFTTDEEVGLVSAEYVRFPELIDFDLLVQIDRGNHSNQLVSSISGRQLCKPSTAQMLIKISEQIGLPRYEVDGMLTDVLCIKGNGICKEAVNMTCGYHNSWGNNKTEFIDIQEAKDTMKYVSNIIQHYYLGYAKKDIQDHINNIDFDIDEDIELVEEEVAPTLHKNDVRRQRRYIDASELFDEKEYKRDRNYYDEIDAFEDCRRGIDD